MQSSHSQSPLLNWKAYFANTYRALLHLIFKVITLLILGYIFLNRLMAITLLPLKYINKHLAKWFFKKSLPYFYFICARLYVHACWSAKVEVRRGSGLPPAGFYQSNRLLGLAAGAFTRWAVLPAPRSFKKKGRWFERKLDSTLPWRHRQPWCSETVSLCSSRCPWASPVIHAGPKLMLLLLLFHD